jgi:SAM-dependent methyltransferase
MKEHDIRPKGLFDGFLAAVAEDAERLFQDHHEWPEVPCPACASTAVASEFSKGRFEYRECRDCGSLYLSPRPPAQLFDQFYRESRAVEFFANRFYKDTEDARRERLFRPRAALVAEWARKLGATEACADIGAGFGTFLEEVRATAVFDRLVAIEPASKLAGACREKGFIVLEETVEQAVLHHPEVSFCTCFEVFEHVHDPLAFVQSLGEVVCPGGIVLFTTLTISGFDLQELWHQSKSIVPPNHINLLSTAGLATLVRRSGLELLDLSTPGQLDVDIVANMMRDVPTTTISRFAQRIVEASEGTRRAFQHFLQEHHLSSHVRVIARRPA